MNYNIDDVIKFKNSEYLILDIIKKEENTYLYLINNNEYLNDVSITKVTNNNGEALYSCIDNDEEFEYVLNKIFLDFKDDILDMANIE